MESHPLLSQLRLGYSPFVDRQRAVLATRLTVFPERADAVPDAAALLALLAQVRPAPAEPEAFPPALNIASEPLLLGMMDALAARPTPHVTLEVPAFLAAAHAGRLQALAQAGCLLLLKGSEGRTGLPPALAGSFRWTMADADPAGSRPRPHAAGTIESGVRTSAAMEAAFARGAVATQGWPFDDPVAPAGGRAGMPLDVQTVLELIGGVDREEPVARLEATLKKDPTLAFRLMRYLNSPAFGLAVEINSFGQALMLVGYGRLKRWLTLLLASAGGQPNARPLMYAAVRRGLMMEELGRTTVDDQTRGELFICGVFSLLDRLLRVPFATLFDAVPVAERVRLALLDEAGEFKPYLDLVQAVELESPIDIRQKTEALFMTAGEVNRALLAALAGARSLD